MVTAHLMVPAGAKADDVIGGVAGENTGRIIVRITIRRRTRLLKLLRVNRRPASQRVPIRSSATVLIGVKHIAGAPAGDDFPFRFYRQCRRAIGSQIAIAACQAALSGSVDWRHRHRQIEAVDEADVVKIEGSEGEFGEGCRCLSRALTFEGSSTSAGLALPVSGLVEVATGSTPYPTGPAYWRLENYGLTAF